MLFLGVENASLLELVVFAILALATVSGAFLTVTRRNPVSAVMSLVGTFFALAGIYATLSAHFLAVLQVLVYAGAIMVLFVFVVMILNREEIEPVAWRGILTRALGAGAIGYGALWSVRLVHQTKDAPLLKGPAAALPETFGTVASNGLVLFRDFVYPFEAISLLLLVAIVGGVIVSRSHTQEEAAVEVANRRRAMRATAGPERRLLPASEEEAAPAAHAASHH